MAYFEGEIPTVVSGSNSGNGGMWGGDGIWAILLLALLGGGFGGNRGGYGAGAGGFNTTGEGAFGWQLGRLATTNDVASGFSTSEIMSDLNDILLQNSQGFANVQQTLCQGFSGINQSLLTGFHGVDNAICNLGYQNQQGFNMLGHQISDCCCKLERGIDGINYNMAKNTCDIIGAINNSNQRVIDYLTSEKIDTLNRKLAVAEGQISNYAQTNAIISALKPCPSPAYVVPNPNCCYTNTCTGIQ